MIREYRRYTNVILPFVITFSVFLIIQELISRSGETNTKNKKPNFVEFIRIKQNDNLQERTRTLPDKPPQPKRPHNQNLSLMIQSHLQ